MFGWLTVLAGGAWFFGECFKSAGEHATFQNHDALVAQFIKENTDPELEEKLWAQVNDRQNYDAIWRRIDKYKKDNLELCLAGGKYRDSMLAKDWEKVGPTYRPKCFRYRWATTRATKAYMDYLESNRCITLSYLIQTYGKHTVRVAKVLALDVYPTPVAKHLW